MSEAFQRIICVAIEKHMPIAMRNYPFQETARVGHCTARFDGDKLTVSAIAQLPNRHWLPKRLWYFEESAVLTGDVHEKIRQSQELCDRLKRKVYAPRSEAVLCGIVSEPFVDMMDGEWDGVLLSHDVAS